MPIWPRPWELPLQRYQSGNSQKGADVRYRANGVSRLVCENPDRGVNCNFEGQPDPRQNRMLSKCSRFEELTGLENFKDI